MSIVAEYEAMLILKIALIYIKIGSRDFVSDLKDSNCQSLSLTARYIKKDRVESSTAQIYGNLTWSRAWAILILILKFYCNFESEPLEQRNPNNNLSILLYCTRNSRASKTSYSRFYWRSLIFYCMVKEFSKNFETLEVEQITIR